MNKDDRQELLEYIKTLNGDVEGVIIDPKDLVFEKEVSKMNCFYCGKYGNNWRCPPNLPDIDYEKMMGDFDAGLFLVLSYDIHSKEEYANIRNDSSVNLHKMLLSLEKWMWNHNSSTAISFIGGSCKLCKGGCGKERCNNPYMSRSPLEATGVNVIKSAEKYGIEIKFPTDTKLKRLGLLLWQED